MLPATLMLDNPVVPGGPQIEMSQINDDGYSKEYRHKHEAFEARLTINHEFEGKKSEIDPFERHYVKLEVITFATDVSPQRSFESYSVTRQRRSSPASVLPPLAAFLTEKSAEIIDWG